MLADTFDGFRVRYAFDRRKSFWASICMRVGGCPAEFRPIMRQPVSPVNSALAAVLTIGFFYLFGLILILIGCDAGSIGTALFGGVLVFGGGYYTVRWLKATRKEPPARK